MRASAIKIFVLCVLGMPAFAVPAAYADSGLCNRFLAFAARVRGDATGEFKRRIGFLLETGKIGDEELAQMVASDALTGPFEEGRHFPADVLPHANAISRLIRQGEADWKEVRGFVEALRRNLGRRDVERAVHDEKTVSIVEPFIIGALKVGAAIGITPKVFWEDGVPYLAMGSFNHHVYVVNGITGKKVASVKMDGEVWAWAHMFERDGRHYWVVSSSGGGIYVIDLLAGRIVRKIEDHLICATDLFEKDGTHYIVAATKEKGADIIEALTGRVIQHIKIEEELSLPVVFKKGGIPYVAMIGPKRVVGAPVWHMVRTIYFVEALTGRVVQKMEVGDKMLKPPEIIEKDGAPYLVVDATDHYLEVIEPFGGRVIQRVDVGRQLSSPPASFEKNGVQYVIATDSVNQNCYVIEALTGRVVHTLPVGYATSPVVFESGGSVYFALSSSEWDRHSRVTTHSISVFEALTGKRVRKIVTGDSVTQPPVVFKKDGVDYLAVGSADGFLYITQAIGEADVRKIKVGPIVAGSPAAYEKDGAIYVATGSASGELSIVHIYGPLPKDGQKK